jgi:phosphoserine phosphatase RsbU/P
VQAVLHAHPAGAPGPATLLMHANRQLCDKQIGGFFTAFLGVYEPVSRRLTYANAGHPPPLLKRAATGSVRLLDGALSYPLGIDDAEEFGEAAVILEAGDNVLLYTDGITEARDAKDDLFSQERLTRAFDNAGGDPTEVIDRLRAAVHAHQHGQPAPDDQTLVLARAL